MPRSAIRDVPVPVSGFMVHVVSYTGSFRRKGKLHEALVFVSVKVRARDKGYRRMENTEAPLTWRK
jgi:hypothetical protein